MRRAILNDVVQDVRYLLHILRAHVFDQHLKAFLAVWMHLLDKAHFLIVLLAAVEDFNSFMTLISLRGY